MAGTLHKVMEGEWRIHNRYTTVEMTAGYLLWILHYLMAGTLHKDKWWIISPHVGQVGREHCPD